MDTFITLIDADDQQPTTIRVGSITAMKRVTPTASSDPDRGEYTSVEFYDSHIRVVETVDQIMHKVADSLEAAWRLQAGVRMVAATERMEDVMKLVRSILPTILGSRESATYEPDHGKAVIERRICTTCKHYKTCASDAFPCKTCLASGEAKTGWERE